MPDRSIPEGHDGIVELPPGKIAAVATYLELRRDEVQTRAAPAGSTLSGEAAYRFEPLDRDLERYRRLYARIGEPWLWFSRARLSDSALASIIADKRVEPLAFVVGGQDVGLIELDFRRLPQCELSFLGLEPRALGQGYGRILITEAIRRAFARPVDRLWLHTCTLDHPGAVAFYMKAGLRPFRRAIEIAQDPRLTGDLPREAAPNLPIV